MNSSDIIPGIVNSFTGKDIKNNMPSPIREIPRNYGTPGVLPDEARLFICVGHKNGLSQWAEITTEPKKKKTGN